MYFFNGGIHDGKNMGDHSDLILNMFQNCNTKCILRHSEEHFIPVGILVFSTLKSSEHILAPVFAFK